MVDIDKFKEIVYNGQVGLLQFDRERGAGSKIHYKHKNCIYCAKNGDTTTLRRSEHVIPDGIGGSLELFGAVCAKCEKDTRSFESRAIRGWYGTIRQFYSISSTKSIKKNRPTTNHHKILVRNYSESKLFQEVHSSEANDYIKQMDRLLCVLPKCVGKASILGNNVSETSIWTVVTTNNSFLSQPIYEEIVAISILKIDDFQRFLIKIAISFSQCILGQLNIFPELRSCVTEGNFINVDRYLGDCNLPTNCDGLHLLAIRIENARYRNSIGWSDMKFVVVSIWPFSFLGGPKYDIVVAPLGASV